MDTQYESSGIEKFFAGSNSLFQVSLAIGAFFYIAFITGLPHIVNIIAGLLGFIAFGALSILSNAYTHRHGIYNQYIDDGMKAAAHSKKAKSQLPIPPLKAFLIRSAIAWIIFIIGLAILLTIGFSVMAGSMAYIVPFTPDNEAMGRLISMIVTLPIVITGFGLIVGMYVVAPAIVDAAIYKNDLIIAHLYEEDEKPMTVGKFAKGMWTVLRASLGVGIGLSVILSLRVGLEFLDEADPPLYIFLPIIAVLIIAGLAFSWWSIKRQANHKTDELMQKMDQELIEQHGENSVEVQNFRIELDEYHALSEKEKKQLAKKDKDKEKPFSIVGQIYGGFSKVMIIGMFIACIGSIGLTFGAAQIGLQGEAIEAVGKLAFPLILIIGAFIYFSRLGKMKFNFPEEFTQMAEASDRGDYARATELAEIAQEKIDLREFGQVIGLVYLQAGDIQKAESVTRESLRQIMFIDESSRNAVFLSLTLTSLGAILIEAERYEEAEEALKQSLQQDNKNSWTLSNLAEVNLFMGRAEQALDYVERAIKINAKKPEAERKARSSYLMFKAWALTLLGQPENIAQLMREAFTLASDNKALQGSLHYYAGHTALAQGKITTANVAFQRAIDSLPGSIIAIQAQRMLDG